MLTMLPPILSNTSVLRCAAPAKINLFLHVVGRRADGYHLLQSAFQLLDFGDTLDFYLRDDESIVHLNPIPGVPAETDLCVRAAHLLQAQLREQGKALRGCDIKIDKQLPMGGGLGGGSSDAATTLIALNYLWQVGLTRSQLQTLGLQLGADVPFFVFGENAFAEGIGEQLQRLSCDDAWYAILAPEVMIPTPQIFSANDLTRNSDHVKIADFSSDAKINREFGKNDLQAVAERLFPTVAEVRRWLEKFGNARMTGSGSCVFCYAEDEFHADVIVKSAPVKAWKAKTLQRHPLAQLLN